MSSPLVLSQGVNARILADLAGLADLAAPTPANALPIARIGRVPVMVDETLPPDVIELRTERCRWRFRLDRA